MAMREYGKVGPQFWIGETGKRLRAAGMEAQITGMYLMTAPHANMLGLYYLPKLYLAHETGLGMEGASKGLQRCIEAGFCAYDEASEMVWVFEMARYQIAESLSSGDKRSAGVQNEYNALPENPYLAAFFEKYGTAYNMTKKRFSVVKNPRPSEAPSKGLGSQEQYQEQEQEQEKTRDATASVPDDAAAPPVDLLGGRPSTNPLLCPAEKIVAAYHELMPDNPRVKVLNEARRRTIAARWREASRLASKPFGYSNVADGLAAWRSFFAVCSQSEFLTGRSKPQPGKPPFLADIDWLMSPGNFAKCLENKYHRDAA
ncbi:hypothetical protein QCE62_07010 [Caballeronia sp. LZ033]|uniref:hypothetical protein n=1 Tax=Caballeronia sp. LZ033 TaxID=3038566 RepID=UPI0028601D36|nr:hypothetical protein [Caballeronia sp. LZ033]MDR5813341.1 hypothetical protein [Caballeronia sp. LZ033]